MSDTKHFLLRLLFTCSFSHAILTAQASLRIKNIHKLSWMSSLIQHLLMKVIYMFRFCNLSSRIRSMHVFTNEIKWCVVYVENSVIVWGKIIIIQSGSESPYHSVLKGSHWISKFLTYTCEDLHIAIFLQCSNVVF